ncbi:MAG: type II toxin-antitoxin system VapC family toxin [bacterium]
MTEIHLDANFIIGALVNESREWQLMSRWNAAGRTVRVSSMAWAEFLCGPVADAAIPEIAHTLGDVLPVTAKDAAQAARLFHLTGRRRGSLADCIIAAIALRSSAEIATNNVDHFSHFAEFGLRIAT